MLYLWSELLLSFQLLPCSRITFNSNHRWDHDVTFPSTNDKLRMRTPAQILYIRAVDLTGDNAANNKHFGVTLQASSKPVVDCGVGYTRNADNVCTGKLF